MGIISVGLKLARLANKKRNEKTQAGAGEPPVVPRPGSGSVAGEPERRPSVGESSFKFPAGSPRPEPLYGYDPTRLHRNYRGSLSSLPKKMIQSDSVEPLASFLSDALKHKSSDIGPSIHRRAVEEMASSVAVLKHIVDVLDNAEIRSEVVPILATLPNDHPDKNVLSAYGIAAKHNPELHSKFLKFICDPWFKTQFKEAIRVAKEEQANSKK